MGRKSHGPVRLNNGFIDLLRTVKEGSLSS